MGDGRTYITTDGGVIVHRSFWTEQVPWTTNKWTEHVYLLNVSQNKYTCIVGIKLIKNTYFCESYAHHVPLRFNRVIKQTPNPVPWWISACNQTAGVDTGNLYQASMESPHSGDYIWARPVKMVFRDMNHFNELVSYDGKRGTAGSSCRKDFA